MRNTDIDSEMAQELMSSHKLVEWSDELSVGIEEIDEQHKMLVELLNRMHEAILEHHAKEVTRGILDELISYTKTHFAVEESLMRVLGYPDYIEHKQQHSDLISEIVELQTKLDDGSTTIGFELSRFLKLWLTKHIMNDDMKYAPHFLSRGIPANYRQESKAGRFWRSLFH